MMLNDRPFQSIRMGSKRIEMRLNDEKRRLINIGDEIEFRHRVTGEKLLTRVCNLTKFKDFEDLYKCFDKATLGYLKNEEATPQDMCQYYIAADIEKYGVLAIEIEVI